MPETITINLAGRDFTVRRLTLRQHRAIGIGVLRAGSADDGVVYAIDQAIEVISAALARDNPDVTMESILDMEISSKDVMKVSASILQFGGFIQKAETASGEAQRS